jgi:hypothetical protein
LAAFDDSSLPIMTFDLKELLDKEASQMITEVKAIQQVEN